MTEFWGYFTKRAQELSSQWTSYTVIGSFFLYVMGYLTLRFHLTVLGIGTDLSVLDERYLFTGARFLIYIISSVPSLIFLLALMATPFILLFRVLPKDGRAKAGNFFTVQWTRLHSWFLRPNRLPLIGIFFSLLMIQLVMRQCFVLNNLLLAEDLPKEPTWFRDLLLSRTDGPMALYFVGLIGGAAVPLTIYYVLRNQADTVSHWLFLITLLEFLLFVQLLLIPVNYGILVVDKSMPRVAGLDAMKAAQGNIQAWLVWEGGEGKTFLLRKQRAGGYEKSLITLSRDDAGKLEITGYDRIFEILYGAVQKPAANKVSL
ncbi:MAG: hypothetical protein ACU84H_13900 [Gammaproteobacteria bacterium]